MQKKDFNRMDLLYPISIQQLKKNGSMTPLKMRNVYLSEQEIMEFQK